jgi:two-component system response regulator RstA
MNTETTHILIVEDDDALAALLQDYLEVHGFGVSRVASGAEGVTRILDERPGIILLDLMLPDISGLDVCRQVRDDFDGSILMLTASLSEADHVAGLELGADDFVTKPIEPRVLLARIRAQIRRRFADHGSGDDGIMEIGALKIDVPLRDVSVDGAEVSLTTMEFDVLVILARAAGTVVNRDDLYDQVMGIPYDGIDRGMDVHVSRIRRKLVRSGFDTSRLKSVRGVGYLLALR